ncbi:ABC transporter substrate-binding protein (plasmid) [Halobaculum sp. CBA1158]|uniref:ABC transporter substrate-binding protein n=1 Tax=Halobaculum sp. CBA1158 TaxID=2904243 RepID=UPI001F174841|nr:ABC transporter substrate-binding protein [Halobaculum sp. CBA1158]UIP01376.1 ABC transporter substrate-binding protein [Halobaculum sp. CBA1158]
MKYGGAVVGGGLLAGCAGQSDSGSTPTDTEADEPSDTETPTPEDESYSVTMSPVGTVEFDAPPERMIAYDRQWLHMAYELGHGDAVAGFDDPGGTWFTLHESLPGVSFETEQIQSFVGEQVDKELIYEIGPDLIAMDPYRAPTLEGLDETDIEELRQNVAPFFANRYSVDRGYEGDRPYEYYTLYELYEKFAQALGEQERFEALRQVDEELTETIQADLPPESERPTVMQVSYFDGNFYTYDIEQGGYGTRHYRNVGSKSAIRETYGDDVPFEFGGTVDMETMLEIDPDILIQGSSLFYPEIDGVSHEGIVESVENEPGAQDLTAIQNDAFYPGGTPYAGPVAYLFYSELTAKYLYPETFGEYPGVGEIPEEEQLFDRQRVSEIVNGDI